MSKRFNRPSESVFFQKLFFDIVYFIPRSIWKLRHKKNDIGMFFWKRKNITKPYKKLLKTEKLRKR